MMRGLSLSVLLSLVDAKRMGVSLENMQQGSASEADAADDMCSCHTDLMPAECEMMAFDGLNGRTCDSNKPVNFGSCMASKGLGLVKDCCPASCCAAKAQGKAKTGPDKQCTPPKEKAAAGGMCSCHTDLMPAECEMMAFDGLNGRTCDSNKPVNFGACMASKGLGLVKDCCPASCCAAKAQGKASTGPDKECAPPYQQAENICKAVAADMGKGLTIKKAASGRIGQMWKEACEMNVVADENFESVAINGMGKVVKVDKGKLTNVEVDGDSFSVPGSKYNFGNGCTLMCGNQTSDEMLAGNGGKFKCAGKRSCVFLKPVSSAKAVKVPPPVPPRPTKKQPLKPKRQAPPVPPRPTKRQPLKPKRQAPPVPARANKPTKRQPPPVPPRPATRQAPPVPPRSSSLPSRQDLNATEGFECGVLFQSSEACFPKKYKLMLGMKPWSACTGQCQSGTLQCSCPNKGEACVSVATKNPGMEMLRYPSPIGTGYWVAKVDKKTREWWYLKMVDGEYQWTPPHNSTGKSYMSKDAVKPQGGWNLCEIKGARGAVMHMQDYKHKRLAWQNV